MKKIFDASAIMLLTKNYPKEAVTFLKDGQILDLTFYELGKTIWKINKLYSKPDQETALESIKQLLYLTALMKTHAIQDKNDIIAIMKNAFLHNLTYYDSAYLTTAQAKKYTLVTEDKALQQAAKTAKVPTLNIETLRKQTVTE